MESKTYLALGDSYTIGEAVLPQESFPYQLASRLTDAGFEIRKPRVIAVTGWTTANLQKAINEAKLDRTYNLVTLLIGVNNQYQGLPAERFRKEFRELLSTSIKLSKKGSEGVFVLSIPDWGVTPFGKNRDSETIATEIDLFNRICAEESYLLKVDFIDISTVSRQAGSDAKLTASDGLHPSGKLYSAWVDRLFPRVKSYFSKA